MSARSANPAAACLAVTLAAALAGSISACVFPAGSSTGLEFTWRFHERSDQGQGHDLVRTCDGARITHVAVRVTDTEDPDRTTLRRYDCAGGYEAAGEQSPPLSEAFFDVRAGTYTVELTAIDDPRARDDNNDNGDGGPARTVATWTEEVSLENSVLLTPVDLSPAPVPWTLEPANADGCANYSAVLRYAEPATDVETPGDGATPPPELYADLTDGWIPCAETPLDFELDRGRYELEVAVDISGDGSGTQCTLSVVIDERQDVFPLDLLAHGDCAAALANPGPAR